MRRKRWKWPLFSMLGLVILLLLFAGLIINYVGYKNVKLIWLLNTSDQSIVRMEAEGEYLTKVKNGNGQELLKERMKSEGWTFEFQEGSGYYFKKANQEALVTTRQIWNRHYIVYDVNDNVVDLSDARK
ncbi:hypothetical protein SAMN05216312_101288 [Cohnella sp. OV330]|uniref:hypothetical protein n=1 Tax=Cohnella sp. OV330 TaxID=1855288 RepID=UPI0008F208B6|nr:hypothetical protein [Cohnella sp. OV330]SFA75285.1 hypothetical protein SAMN05216312_101288 [Cohnella sp. OV330]